MPTPIPTPPYTILYTIDKVTEIREYGALLSASLVFQNYNEAFMDLFNFISGENNTKETYKMTVPVLFKYSNTKSMHFIIHPPPQHLPSPTNSQIKISLDKNQIYATIAFYGAATHSEYEFQKKLLKRKLKQQAAAFDWDAPVFAVYTQPGILIREHHEVWVPAIQTC